MTGMGIPMIVLMVVMIVVVVMAISVMVLAAQKFQSFLQNMEKPRSERSATTVDIDQRNYLALPLRGHRWKTAQEKRNITEKSTLHKKRNLIIMLITFMAVMIDMNSFLIQLVVSELNHYFVTVVEKN